MFEVKHLLRWYIPSTSILRTMLYNSEKGNKMKMNTIAVAVSVLLLSSTVNAAIIPATLYGEAETGDSMWTFTDTSGNLDDSGFVLNAEFGGSNSTDRSFGMYQYDLANDAIVNMLEIFDSTEVNSGTASANVVLNNLTGIVSTSLTEFIDTNLVAGLGFGWYFSSDTKDYFSQTQFNTADEDFFGVYTESDPFAIANTHLYASDNGTGSSLDWVKMSISDIRTGDIVGITSNVPEPASVMLMGLGLLGMAGRRRYKQSK
jgi:hypothetical protein